MTESARGPSTVQRGRRRWYVHVGLMTALAGSLATLIYLSKSITVHVIFGVAFMVFVLFHLYQRRRTIRALTSDLIHGSRRAGARRRLATSDVVLELLVANVLVSGIVDALHHRAADLQFLARIGFPPGLVQWHKLAGIVLVIYVIVHITRRRTRLRRSQVQ